jgi:hypothetical protein
MERASRGPGSPAGETLIYHVLEDQGRAIDAQPEIGGKDVVFHSRGGTKGENAKNVDYADGLQLILRRIQIAKLGLEAAWVDSSRVQSRPLSQRQILAKEEAEAPPEQLFTLLSPREPARR